MITLCLVLAGAIADDAHVREATGLMDRFEYANAAQVLVESERAEHWTAAERAQLFGLIGVCRAELRDQAGATKAFERAIDLDAEVQLPPDTSPKIVELLEGVRERHAPAPAPQITATAPPEAARPPADPSVDRAADSAESAVDAGGSGVPAAGVVVLAAGAGIATIGAGLWGWGLVSNRDADGQRFQDDAAAIQQRSAVGQVAGQIVLAVGGAVVAGAIAWIALAP